MKVLKGYISFLHPKRTFLLNESSIKWKFSHRGLTDITSLKTTGIEKTAFEWLSLNRTLLPTCCYYFPLPSQIPQFANPSTRQIIRIKWVQYPQKIGGQTTLVPVCEQDQVVLEVVNISVLISLSKALAELKEKFTQ